VVPSTACMLRPLVVDGKDESTMVAPSDKSRISRSVPASIRTNRMDGVCSCLVRRTRAAVETVGKTASDKTKCSSRVMVVVAVVAVVVVVVGAVVVVAVVVLRGRLVYDRCLELWPATG
jgi:hypothetical protein